MSTRAGIEAVLPDLRKGIARFMFTELALYSLSLRKRKIDGSAWSFISRNLGNGHVMCNKYR